MTPGDPVDAPGAIPDCGPRTAVGTMKAVSAGPSHPGAPLPQPLRRSHAGRWLGGVCSGMAARWGTPVGQLRALFVVTALFAGLGVLAYAACWLVLPSEQDDESPSLLRGVASVSLLLAALAGLATIGLLAAAATLFGFGWAVVVAAAVFLAGALLAWPATGPAWILVPLVAAVLPAVVVAASGVRIDAQAGLVQEQPLTPREIPRDGYRAGLGELFVDLRGFRAPPDAIVPLRLETGLGRTVVALPRDRCFDLDVTYETGTAGWSLVRRLSQGLRGWGPLASAGSVHLFGEWQPSEAGRWTRRSDDPHAPTLKVDFRSVDGDLWLRDYPVGAGPLHQTDWPYDGAAYDAFGQPIGNVTPERLERLGRGACALGARRAERRARRVARARRATPERGR